MEVSLSIGLRKNLDGDDQVSVSNSLSPHLRSTRGRGTKMLKISIVASPTQRRLALDGALIDQWLSELRAAWMGTSIRKRGRRIVLDYNNVTLISADGEAILWELNRGARSSPGEIPSKHILHRNTRKKRAQRALCALQPSTAEEQ